MTSGSLEKFSFGSSQRKKTYGFEFLHLDELSWGKKSQPISNHKKASKNLFTINYWA